MCVKAKTSFGRSALHICVRRVQEETNMYIFIDTRHGLPQTLFLHKSVGVSLLLLKLILGNLVLYTSDPSRL